MGKFSKGHFSIAIFVVQLEDFCKVFNVSDVLVLLGLAVDWEEFVDLQLLLVCEITKGLDCVGMVVIG